MWQWDPVALRLTAAQRQLAQPTLIFRLQELAAGAMPAALFVRLAQQEVFMTGVTIHSTQERVTMRPYRDEEDFRRVRNLLIETRPLTPPDFNWDVRRWDGSRFHNKEAVWEPHWEGRVGLWETADGRLVGAVNPDEEGVASLQIHPDYRHIEEEMMAWAESHLSKATKDGSQRQLGMSAFEYDSWRRHLLEQRGFEKTAEWGVIRRLRFDNKVLPPVEMPEGYILRAARADDPDEHQAFADLLNAAFNREFHNAQEISTFRATAPSYRAELDLFAEAADGSLAANVGVIYVEEVKAGLYEPVCTHPDHRRKGLASMLMWEGMHRLQALGATEVTVFTGDRLPANRMYESVGFPEIYKLYHWRKVF
jgi:mycothiol synthase